MRKKEIEKRIARAVSHGAPDNISGILQKCDRQEGDVISMKKSNKWTKIACAAAAVVLLAAAGFTAVNMYNGNRAVAVVSLDVNPGMELKISANDKVMEVTAANDDASELLKEVGQLKGKGTKAALDAIVGALVEKGYLNDSANSVLVTVEGEESAKVEKQIVEHLDAVLAQNITDGSVISIELEKKDEQVAEFAQKHNITQGKAELIDKIAQKNPVLVPDELANLSINELGVLISSEKVDGSNVKQSGQASTKDYIGNDAALSKALEHASLTADQVTDVEVELDFKGGSIVYEVEFSVGAMEYEHVINAIDGTVVKCKQEEHDDDDNRDEKAPAPAFNAQEARDIALEAAKVALENIGKLDVELERKNGIDVYQIRFTADGLQYTYCINAQTKEIVSSAVKVLQSNENKVPQAQVSVQQAKDIVLEHAAVADDAVKGYRSKIDIDDGITVYEIEFIANGFEYEYEVDATTGEILDVEKEASDHDDDDDFSALTPIEPQQPGQSQRPQKPEGEAPVKPEDMPEHPNGDAPVKPEDMPEHPNGDAPVRPEDMPEHPNGDAPVRPEDMPEHPNGEVPAKPEGESVAPKEALDKALQHAGVDKSQVSGVEIETEHNGARPVHKVEFKHDGAEHEYYVDATTGQIMHNEIDD